MPSLGLVEALRDRFPARLPALLGMPNDKRLARDGLVNGAFALFFYLQREYAGAYTCLIVYAILCAIATICVNTIEKIGIGLVLSLNPLHYSVFM